MSDLKPCPQIALLCPKCGRRQMVKRADYDYPEAVRMELTCLKCNAGDFSVINYFDASGKHIIRDQKEDV